jgi:uncharacterized paraquat-inducible protein A
MFTFIPNYFYDGRMHIRFAIIEHAAQWEFMTWVIGIAAIMATARLAHALAHPRKRDPRFCFVCGYDLTANVSGKCPECGHRLNEAQRQSLAKTE